MPQSRKRPGHPYQKPADIPAKQRAKGRIIWAILFGVFGLVIAFFASDQSYTAMVIGALIAGCLGYVVGRNMEQQSAKG
jgi:uncharacterized membrane protein YjjB (DUF3815 family)